MVYEKLKTYVFVKVLKGEEAEEWKQSRRKVVFDLFKRRKLDGINPYYKAVAYTTAEVLREEQISETGVEC